MDLVTDIQLEINEDEIYSISQLNNITRRVIEQNFPLVWVQGEISNLARPASGHLYFTLKDEAAQVRCAMFRPKSQRLRFNLKDGMHVLAHVKVGFYETRGEFQLIVEQMEETGDGALQRQFEQLKQKLAQEGLFDQNTKQKLPLFPSRLGVITSPTGAAIRDILSILKRRYPGLPVIIYPANVQGEGAAQNLLDMVVTANQRQECDVLLLTRGGGSLEDLMAFNDEKLARAIFSSQIPIVTGIGHEIDFTIADFVADIRAPTPSAAAELISPNRFEWLDNLLNLRRRIILHINNKLKQDTQMLAWLRKRLRHPSQRLSALAQRLDDIEQRLLKNQLNYIHHIKAKLLTTNARLNQHSPAQKITSLLYQNLTIKKQLLTAIEHNLAHQRSRLQAQAHALETVSPLATLSRGYAIVKRRKDNVILRYSKDIDVGESISAQLHAGEIICTVNEIKKS